MLQRGVDVQRHHQAGREPQRVIRLACWLDDGGCGAMDLLHKYENMLVIDLLCVVETV